MSFTETQVIPFQPGHKQKASNLGRPKSELIALRGKALDQVSKYKSQFDYKIYRRLEARWADKPVRGGVVMGTALRLANAHETCQQCLYSFEIDTYGRGCTHDCAYCYAKAELTVHGYWNNPIPVPIDINQVRHAFYIAFETEKKNKWSDILRRRIPLRIGAMSDSFMWVDRTYKVTQELLRILAFYEYPYTVVTRSDLIAEDEYLKLLDSRLAGIQFSIPSVNDELSRTVEPGAPSPSRRLKALKRLAEAGFWTTVRINPLFPIYPDGYFTDPNFQWDGVVPKLEYSTFEMVDIIADHKVPAILAGFGRFSRLTLNAFERTLKFNLRQFYRRNLVEKSPRDFHYSDAEIRYYYEQIAERCTKRNVGFTTCYIGNGEDHFWKDQDLWSNKVDCCNIKNQLAAFRTDSREIPFESRIKFTSVKYTVPVSNRLHEPLGLQEQRVDQSLAKSPEPAVAE